MPHIRTAIKTSLIYITSLVLVAGSPLTALAQEAPVSDTPTSTSEPANPAVTPQQSETQTQETPKESTAPSSESSEQPTEQTQASPQAGTDTVTKDTTVSENTDTKNDATIENKEDSKATSGDAAVTQNINAGDASTGNAAAQTTIINSVHSTVAGETNGVAHFTTDIHGNVYGDITISPSINSATQLTNANMSSIQNIDNNDTIHNDVNLAATTGSATVSQNITGGSATTGNANTVANVINLINSIISANKSFVGTINIYGDLNGDILVSPEFIPQLLSSNGSNLNNQSSTSIDTSLSASLNNNQQIINNIQLSATTGNALVQDNVNAGSATTGKAGTNLTVLNLTGHEVTATNSLLVFVNVLGKWIGMIVDAPAGSTSALIGNGVTKNTTTSYSSDLNINNSTKIQNDINLASASGNASVTQNINGGSATTGNATASANVANIDTSMFSLTDWFGVLFINVFGTWEGSFGINTANGDIIPISGNAMDLVPQPAAPAFHFGFTPKAKNAVYRAPLTPEVSGPDTTNQTPSAEVVRATLAKQSTAQPTETLTENQSPRQNPFNTVMMYAGLGIAAIGLLIAASRRFF